MNNLGRSDVERIVENVLRELSLNVLPSTINNRLKIELKYKDTILSDTYFSIEPEDYS